MFKIGQAIDTEGIQPCSICLVVAMVMTRNMLTRDDIDLGLLNSDKVWHEA